MAREEQVALRKWGLGKDVEITAEEIKAMFNDVITAGGYNMMAYVVEYNGESIVKIKSDANADYMPVSSEIYKEKGETGVFSYVTGKGEQIKAKELEKLYYKAMGEWHNFRYGVNKGKAIAARFGMSAKAAGIGAGAGYAAGLAIRGTFKLFAKGFKLLMRDKEKYEKEMAFYKDALGIIDFVIGGADSNYAIRNIMKNAETGDAIAQYILGTAYLQGIGVESGQEKAIEWFEKAADNGENRSRNIVANEFLFGEAEYTTEQKNKGIEYLEEFADAGEEWAEEALVDIYYKGSVNGIPSDETKAFEYADRYSEMDNIYSKFALANICDSAIAGYAPFKDDKKAAALYNQLLSEEDGEYAGTSAFNLGIMFREGRGVDRNTDNAINCFELAAKCQNTDGYRYLLGYFADGEDVDSSLVNKGCDYFTGQNEAEMMPAVYYCRFKLADRDESYKSSMEYANRYIECENADEDKKEELKKYLAEKNEQISNMTDAERRKFLKEKKPLFSGDESSKKKKIIIACAAAAVIIGIILLLALNGNNYNGTDSQENGQYGCGEPDYSYDSYASYEQYANDFIFYDSNCRYLEDYEVSSLSEDDIQMAINEIYARKGVNFENEPYVSHFNSCEWYNPIYSQAEFDSSWFNEYEEANVNLLAYYRNNNTENGDDIINNEDEALDYAIEYANKEGIYFDSVMIDGESDRGYTVRGYEDMGDHINTMFLWTIEPNGDIYDEQNWYWVYQN